MHSADYTVARCLSVCLSVCLSHAGILSTSLNISSKSCAVYRTAPFSTTLNDPYTRLIQDILTDVISNDLEWNIRRQSVARSLCDTATAELLVLSHYCGSYYSRPRVDLACWGYILQWKSGIDHEAEWGLEIFCRSRRWQWLLQKPRGLRVYCRRKCICKTAARWADKSNTYCPLPYRRGHNKRSVAYVSANGLCVFGGLCVNMWRLVHHWSFLLFDCFWRLAHCWYQLCHSSKTVKRQSNSKNDHWCTNRHMSTQSPPNTQSLSTDP